MPNNNKKKKTKKNGKMGLGKKVATTAVSGIEKQKRARKKALAALKDL